MIRSAKTFVALGCFLLAIAFILRYVGFYDQDVLRTIKPSSLLILANISFVIALLFKK